MPARLNFDNLLQLGPEDSTDGVSIGGAWPGVPGGLGASDDFPGWDISTHSGIFQDAVVGGSDPELDADLPQFLNPPKLDATLAAQPTIVYEPTWQQIINPFDTVEEFLEHLKPALDKMDMSYGIMIINGRKVIVIRRIMDGHRIEVRLHLYSPTQKQSKFVLGYFCISGDPAASSTFFDELSHYIKSGGDATRPYVRPTFGLGLLAPHSKESDGPQTAQNQKPPHGQRISMILNPQYPEDALTAALALFNMGSSAGLLPWFSQLAAVVLDEESTEGGAPKRPRDDMPPNPDVQLCISAVLVKTCEVAAEKRLLPMYGVDPTKLQFSSEIALAVYRGLPALFRKMLEIVQDFKSDVEGARWMIKCLGTLVGIMKSLGLPTVDGMYAKMAATFKEVADKCEFLRKTIDAVMEA